MIQEAQVITQMNTIISHYTRNAAHIALNKTETQQTQNHYLWSVMTWVVVHIGSHWTSTKAITTLQTKVFIKTYSEGGGKVLKAKVLTQTHTKICHYTRYVAQIQLTQKNSLNVSMCDFVFLCGCDFFCCVSWFHTFQVKLFKECNGIVFSSEGLTHSKD